ncbi:MAG: outer membrane beta-barrel domain-containing protein [Oligoflexales bacterium]|nr:outer membrane beta-barrel domain-containing protein [Oligoflexales bacterium]
MCIALPLSSEFIVKAEEFKDYEIRVIRPRYFTKAKRFELGSQALVVMNQTFIYSYLASGVLTYHFNEYLGLEMGGVYGFSNDKDDKGVLKRNFEIRTRILRTEYMMYGGVIATPIYGKYQMPGGTVIYFDTFVTATAGLTGINYKYDWCPTIGEVPENQRAGFVAPEEKTVGYPTISVGMGQKFYINKNTALRWDIRNHSFTYDEKDSACNPDLATSSSSVFNNVTLQLGASRFF